MDQGAVRMQISYKTAAQESMDYELLTHHRAMHNASHGGIASYFADTVD